MAPPAATPTPKEAIHKAPPDPFGRALDVLARSPRADITGPGPRHIISVKCRARRRRNPGVPAEGILSGDVVESRGPIQEVDAALVSQTHPGNGIRESGVVNLNLAEDTPADCRGKTRDARDLTIVSLVVPDRDAVLTASGKNRGIGHVIKSVFVNGDGTRPRDPGQGKGVVCGKARIEKIVVRTIADER